MKYVIGLMLLLCQTSYATIHVTIKDAEGIIRSIEVEVENGEAVTEGDIIVRQNKSRSSYNIAGGLWDKNEIPVLYSPELPDKTQAKLKKAIAVWEQHTHVAFKIIKPDDVSHYPNHILVIPNKSTHCSAEVGMKGGEQFLRLAPRCGKWQIVHELGHALGLWHEQSRHDRDHYVAIVWTNIKKNHVFNFNQHLTDGKDLGPYDYDSIMHYSSFAFSKNGQATIIPLKSAIKIGQRDHLSQGDIDGVNRLYSTSY